ncbi:MAG TPA: NAD-dependent epimerase/dehydratase family protein [Gaiellales bacterium]|nr:NAD-dependent epimerase/dehydratase family protein [Gaiellales bacterium]
MRLLILGGTVFLGRHASEQALERGHELTLFTRGRTNAGLFPDVEHLHGDRDGGLAPLAGREFDAVIDTSGYFPRVVADSARLLAPTCGHYTFVSSVSVYDQNGGAGSEVDGPVGTIEDATIEEITETSYGPLKALCEQAVEHEFGDRALVVRPGLIVGPDDPTDRFTYWPARIAEGGTVLAPGDPGARTQVIDVRDLAGWMVEMAERGADGRFNAVGPAQPLTIGALLDRCNAISGAGADIVWADNQALLDHEVEPWSDLPLWLGGDPELEWMDCVDPGPAVAAGLRHRPIDETIADTLAWHRANRDAPGRAGFRMSREREATLLAELA